MTASISLTLPPAVHEAAERLAGERGLSLDQWVATLVEGEIGAVESAPNMVRRRSAGLDRGAFGRFLDTIPEREPMPGDERP